MGQVKKIILSVSMCIVAGIMFTGCGVTSKKLDDAEKRIDALQKSGMPDSLLSEARVTLVQVKTAKKFGGGASPQRLYDSVMTLLGKAEMVYTGALTQVKPSVEALRKTFDGKKQSLTGAQLKEAESLIKDVDSCIKINKWTEAKEKCVMVDAALNSLIKDEKTAAETKAKLTGTWVGVQKTKDKQAKADYTEKKEFTFSPDGKVNIIEERNGQTNEVIKEDWKFQSGGTFSLKGDTIIIAITKEKCFKQIFTTFVEKNGKAQWVKKEKPPYDSTITSGKKDRFVTFGFITQNFKKH
jgi:hypothetical protein